MTATVSLRVFTGTNAGTESSEQTTVDLCSDDTIGGGDVLPGSYSFERWLALRLDSPPALGVANFWFIASGDLPAGVVIRFGVTDTGATPVETASAVATRELQPDRRYIFDTATYVSSGDHTRYLVFQEQVAADVTPGAIDPLDYTFGWVEA